MTNMPEEKLQLGPMVFSEALGIETPAFLTVQRQTFFWSEQGGCYEGLYVEPDDNDGTISPDSYYEIEGSGSLGYGD